jgi:hypothetical protein
MEKISWTDRVKNEKVLQRVKEKRNNLHKRKGSLTGLVIPCVENALYVYKTLLKER